MAKQQTDEELNLKRKARRRLVGAITLTLAVVVILPMVLESEPRQSAQDIDLRIPPPDKAGEFVPEKTMPSEAQQPPKAAEAPKAEVSPVPVASAVVAVPVAQAASAVTPASKAKADASPHKEPVAAKPAATVKPDAAKPAETLMVQVGAYANANTAKQELDKLKGWGFKLAHTEKVGDKVRVRVGPYTEREKAEKVRGLLEKHGLRPVIMGSQ